MSVFAAFSALSNARKYDKKCVIWETDKAAPENSLFVAGLWSADSDRKNNIPQPAKGSEEGEGQMFLFQHGVIHTGDFI